eukprot:15355993-Ditylum_brightwellii.AAC.1
MSKQKRSSQQHHSTRNNNNEDNDGNPPKEDTSAVAASKSGPKQKTSSSVSAASLNTCDSIKRSPQQTPAAESMRGSRNKINNKNKNNTGVGISQENNNRGEGSGLGLEDADLYKNQQGEEGMYKLYPKDRFMTGCPFLKIQMMGTQHCST